MRRHLSDEKLWEALEGGASPAHLGECGECRARLEEAREGLALARQADVPEPPLQYWQGFRRRLGDRLDEPRRVAWRGWLLWPALAALAAGLLFLALPQRGVVTPRRPSAALPAWSPLAASDAVGVSLLQAVADDLGPEAECREVEECVSDLSDAQSRELAEMLRQELPGRQS